MPRPEVTLPERARGALLGHAAGNALGVPTEFLGTAEAIEREYPGGLREVRRRDTAQSPWDDDIAMSVHLADELLEPEPDLERLTIGGSSGWRRMAGGSAGGPGPPCCTSGCTGPLLRSRAARRGTGR